jgi:hypothetical protein
MRATTCTPEGDVGCPAVCLIPSIKCTIPPLAPGEYVVEVAGEGPRVGLPPRTLVVTNDGAESTCSLPQHGSLPDELDGSKYARNCSVDEDCVIARVGNLCQPCACPNTAIAKSVAASYESDFRARSSQCAPQKGPIACAACAPVKPSCDTSSGLTGTCKLVPGF